MRVLSLVQKQVNVKPKGWIGNDKKKNAKWYSHDRTDLCDSYYGDRTNVCPNTYQYCCQSGLVAVQQEAIAASSSEIGMILTRDWDEAGTDETTESPILIVTNGDAELEMILAPDGNSSGRRAGTPTTSSRKSFSSAGGLERAATLAAAFEAENDDDDIDDFNSDTITLTGIRYA